MTRSLREAPRAQVRASRRSSDRRRHRRDGGRQLRPPTAARPSSTSRRSTSCAAGRRRTASSGSARATTYTELMDGPVAEALPALAEAARTVGSPQIRNRGTVGGNLGTARPPATRSAAPRRAGHRRARERAGRAPSALESFLVGPKRNALEPDELIAGGDRRRGRRGRETFMKVGPRNAMVIAVCSLALASTARRSSCRRRSARPAPRRVSCAPTSEADDFADAVAEAASPIDDVGGTARYRRQRAGRARRPARWSAAWREDLAHGQRRPAPDGRLAGREPALRAARAPRPARLEERLRAGRVRLVLGAPRRVLACSCLVLAAQADGHEVVTVEGLAARRAAPRAAGVRRGGAVQCGFCTPGSSWRPPTCSSGCLASDDDEIREALSGNLCRCTGYGRILEAVRSACLG